MRVYRHQPRSTDIANPRPISFFTYSRNRRFVRRVVFIAPFSSSSLSISPRREPTTTFRQWKLRARGRFSLIRPRSERNSRNLLSRQTRTSSFCLPFLSSTCSSLRVVEMHIEHFISFFHSRFHLLSLRELGTQSNVEVIFPLAFHRLIFFYFYGAVFI